MVEAELVGGLSRSRSECSNRRCCPAATPVDATAIPHTLTPVGDHTRTALHSADFHPAERGVHLTLRQDLSRSSRGPSPRRGAPRPFERDQRAVGCQAGPGAARRHSKTRKDVCSTDRHPQVLIVSRSTHPRCLPTLASPSPPSKPKIPDLRVPAEPPPACPRSILADPRARRSVAVPLPLMKALTCLPTRINES